MKKISKSTIAFLEKIKDNNYREWFLENKADYTAARENFESFVEEILKMITEFDPLMKGLELKNCVYRFNRDTRFTEDKSPYKSHFGAFMVRGGKRNADKLAGYYLHIEPGNSMVAGGAYMPPAPWLQAVREKIDDNGKVLDSLLKEKEFVKYFGELEGEKLKKAPKGYPNDHPWLELLKYKSYLAMNVVKDDFATGDDFFEYTLAAFRAMKPLNDFLNEY